MLFKIYDSITNVAFAVRRSELFAELADEFKVCAAAMIALASFFGFFIALYAVC